MSFLLSITSHCQALFASAVILLFEKVFLHWVAINFHQKALADRLAENRLGLKTLDRLSNAQPAPKKTTYPYSRRGHKTGTSSADLDHAARSGNSIGRNSPDVSPDQEKGRKKNKKSTERKQKRRKAMASIIVDQVGFSSTFLADSS